MKRTDTHRPSAINPEEYEYVAQEVMKIEGLGDVYAVKFNRDTIKAHMSSTGGTYSKHQHGGNCMCCGSVNAIYTTLFYHHPTNTYVRFGSTCAEKLDMGNVNDFRAIKKAIKDAREAKAGKQKAAAILSDNGLDRAWELYNMGDDMDAMVAAGAAIVEKGGVKSATTDWSILVNIVGNIIKWGNPSEKQLNYLKVLVDRIANMTAIRAKWAAEKEAALEVPEGRIEVEGAVLKVEERDTFYGLVWKMTVKSDDGWIVWGSVPNTLNVKRGDRIRFKGTVTKSDNDPKFGFFKRPSNGEVVNAA